MALVRYARSKAIRRTSAKAWDSTRVSAHREPLEAKLISTASDILGDALSPEKYLLSHATIVCSVDTENAPNCRLGSIKDGDFTINRPYPDYHVTPATEKYANNNNDAWERKLLLKSYRTFIGADNFFEHVQIPELSKGKVIDAIPRDVGDSVYIDILIATALKHAELIDDIRSGRIRTLSMGCHIDASCCSRCGHVGADETELCTHVRHCKGSRYHDSNGVLRKVVELCGHHSVDPTGGVRFNDASWVKVPAFTGAVMRNILDPGDVSQDMVRRASDLLSSSHRRLDLEAMMSMSKAATLTSMIRLAAETDIDEEPAEPPADPAEDPAGGGEEGAGGEEAGGGDEPTEDELADAFGGGGGDTGVEEDDVDKAVGDLVKWMADAAKAKIKEKMTPKREESPTAANSTRMNDSVIHQASVRSVVNRAYNRGLHVLASVGRTDAEAINMIMIHDRAYGVASPDHVYRAAVLVGPMNRYGSVREYAAACAAVMKRKPTERELAVLIRIGRLVSGRGRK